jgi:mRNA interferase HigB
LFISAIYCIFAPKLKERTTVMKILFPERIEEFSRKHADAKEALERWSGKLADAEWKSHADLKADFPSADFVGNNRYVFNIKGNNYRTVVLVVFFAGTVAIRFIGTHSEYDKIKDIKNI